MLIAKFGRKKKRAIISSEHSTNEGFTGKAIYKVWYHRFLQTMSKVLRGKCGKYFFFRQHLATEVEILKNAINMPRTVKDLNFMPLAS